MVEITVVIPTLKSREDIEAIRCLENGEFSDYELIVTDEYPVTRARNEGIRRASADKIVFLDDDSRPVRGYLKRAAETLDREPAFAGRTIHPCDDIFAHHFTAHYDRGETEQYVDHFWGNNMGVRRDVFETVGGWDENMGWGHEEKELADRVRSEYEILYDPELVVVHSYADSVVDVWRKKYQLETQSPYYWRRCGDTTAEQVRRTAVSAITPQHYARRDAVGTLVQIGVQVGKTAGRVHGLINEWDTTHQDTSEVPFFDQQSASNQSPST